MSLPSSVRLVNLPIEQVTFAKAIEIIKSLYGYQHKYPFDGGALQEIIDSQPTGTGNIWVEDDLIWVWEKFLYMRKYGPKRCLVIVPG